MCEHNIYYSLCISFMKDNKASYLLFEEFRKSCSRKRKSVRYKIRDQNSAQEVIRDKVYFKTKKRKEIVLNAYGVKISILRIKNHKGNEHMN